MGKKPLKAFIMIYILLNLAAAIWINGEPARKTMKAGFMYERRCGQFWSWQYVDFYHVDADGHKTRGPSISGSRFSVKCLDIDYDGWGEFRIRSKSSSYETLVDVDPFRGTYHIIHNIGLKVNFPPEGYFFL